jgi:hypothetical protein
MDKSCRYIPLCRGVLDLSSLPYPFSITKSQTLVSRFATFSSQYVLRIAWDFVTPLDLPHILAHARGLRAGALRRRAALTATPSASELSEALAQSQDKVHAASTTLHAVRWYLKVLAGSKVPPVFIDWYDAQAV